MDVAITELEKIEADRIDGVGQPANGIPILMLKQVAEPEPVAAPDAEPEPEEFDREAAKALCRSVIAKAVGADGQVDEEPDVAGGTHVLEMIADLIIAEAQELKAGQAGEICDILELACAAEKIWCWRTGEEAVSTGSVMPATVLAQSALPSGGEVMQSLDRLYAKSQGAAAYKSGPTAAERRKAASEGNALPDGSYPIRNVHELHSAAILARSGHGDVAAAKRLIARRAKELGVKNPLEDDDTSKSQIADGGADVDTVTQDGSLAKAVEDAVTKAVAPLAKEIADLKSAKDLLAGELAKVKAMPIPGGPVMTAVTPRRTADGEDRAAMVKRIRDTAESFSDPAMADGYRQWAQQIESEAKTS